MSTCPEKDLHSVYIDGEMPQEFIKEYESHLGSCKKCSEELGRMKQISEILRSDSKDLSFDQAFLDASFERLQTKMRYAKNTEISKGNVYKFSLGKVVTPLAAAAAVLAVFLLPGRLSSIKDGAGTAINAITRNTSIQPIAEKGIVIDGNIPRGVISQALTEDNVSTVSNNNSVIRGATLASNNSAFNARDFIPGDVDVFRPEFSRETSRLPIKIRVPGIRSIGETEHQSLVPQIPYNVRPSRVDSGLDR